MLFRATQVMALLACLASPLLANDAAPLFKMGDKTYTAKDLPSSAQQALFDVDNEAFQRRKATVEGAVLDLYFDQQAAKQKKSKADIEAQELKVGDISEKEMKKFYEENKARVPYPYEQVSGEIRNYLTAQKRQEKRQQLLDKVMKSQKVTMLVAAPVAPVVDINTAGFHTAGKSGSKVKIVEFADYQCPHCKAAAEAMTKLRKKYSNKVEFVFIDFPINASGISKMVAQGAYCAGLQNKYWEYHELAFEKQASLSKESPLTLAKDLKLNEGEFQKCYAGNAPTEFVDKARNEGERVGISGTPTIFINGRKYAGNNSFEALAKEIDAQL